MERLNYWRRIFKVYLTKNKGYLNFWHEQPAVSEGITKDKLGPYYMTFEDKANYKGPRDKDGVILFDYFSNIGRQYNPVAIAQYGLGRFNLYLRPRHCGPRADGGKQLSNSQRESKHGGDSPSRDVKEDDLAAIKSEHLYEAKIHADWLVRHLESNQQGLPVWRHHFEWHYKKLLPAGWYSALSQGAGISLLTRLYAETKDEKYLHAAETAFKSMNIEMENGGVRHTDKEGNIWLEEYMITPPTHIINGFLWALWGVYDFWLTTRKPEAKKLFDKCVKTLKHNLSRYDTGFWSLYDLSKQKMKMLASPFYHALHVTQFKATHLLTGEEVFDKYHKKFNTYQKSWWRRKLAFAYKAIFKLIYF